MGWCQAKPNGKHKPFNQTRKGIKHMQSIQSVHDTQPILQDQKENQWNKETNSRKKEPKERPVGWRAGAGRVISDGTFQPADEGAGLERVGH